MTDWCQSMLYPSISFTTYLVREGIMAACIRIISLFFLALTLTASFASTGEAQTPKASAGQEAATATDKKIGRAHV